MKKARKYPYLLTIVLLWAAAKSAGLSMSASSISGLVFLAMAIAAGFLEVYKGADVGLGTFKLELFTALLATVAATLFLCLYVVPRGAVQTADVVITAMVVVDAWLSPTIAYATALRNFAANTDPQ